MKITVHLDLDNYADELTYDFIKSENHWFAFVTQVGFDLRTSIDKISKDALVDIKQIQQLEAIWTKFIEAQCDNDIAGQIQRHQKLCGMDKE